MYSKAFPLMKTNTQATPQLSHRPLFDFRSYERIPYSDFRKSGGDSYIKLDNGWTNYELTGDATSVHTVVLIHGGTIPLCIWEPQMSPLLNAGFRVLRYDQYGRGFSDRPQTTFSRDLYVRQLKDLLDSLSITAPVTLVGPSFGGAISVQFAALYPQRVRALVLVSPALNILNSDSPLCGPLKILRMPFIGKICYRAFIRSKILSRGISLVSPPCSDIYLNQFICIGTERALFSQFRSDAYGDYRELTRKAGEVIPNILLIRGKSDAEITEKMIAETKSDLPSCTFVELEGGGHNPAADVANQFNKLIVDYIGSH